MGEIKEKILFVSELNDALVKVQHNLVSVEYQVFENKEYGYFDEVLVINYKGGARSVRNCTGNSCSAIFEEIADKLRHGYYAEEKWMQAIENDPNMVRIYE